MKNLLLAAATCALLSACAGLEVREARTDETQLAGGEPGSPDEMICKQEKVAGSVIRKRVCMTRAERDAIKEESASGVRGAQGQGRTGCAAGASCGI